MKSSPKTFCNTHARHLRLMFFVDKSVSESFLIDLFMHNYQLWGGRYNPVIPVYDNELTPFYENYLTSFDPDIVYYSEQIGLEAAQAICKKLHPKELVQLDPNGRDNFPGVYSHYLLPEAKRQANKFLRNFALIYFQRNEEDPQTTFYNLSFGIRNQYVEDIALSQGYRTTILDVTNIAEINTHIAEHRPFFNCLLAEQQAEFCYLSPTNDWELNCLEFIIYDERKPFDDLIYFWNRALSQKPRGEILQLIASRRQLELLLTDPNFGGVLNSVARDNKIYLNSLSLESAEIEQFRNALQTAYPGTSFRISGSQTYPRVDHAELFPHKRQITTVKNVLLGEKDHLRLPTPIWSSDKPITQGRYVYDAEFYDEGDHAANYVKFPYGTVPQFLLGNNEARVNKVHNISYYLSQDQQNLDVKIPASTDIFISRLRSRVEHGVIHDLPVHNLSISDAGLKLASFVNLFNGQLWVCSELLLERFWVDLILGKSSGSQKKRFDFKRMEEIDGENIEQPFSVDMGVSNIHNNDGTFNHLDLEAERKLIYLEHAEGTRNWLAAEGLNYTDDQLIDFMNVSAKEDFEHHIDRHLQYFTDLDALFIGMKVKCSHCGSNSWYALVDLKNKMSCKGCLQTVIPTVESRLYYRFNDVVYNNLSSDPVKREKTFHGNYLVLRTLSYFATHGDARESFLWSPSLDLRIQSGSKFVRTDIDIAMIRHGKLMIGEAKASGSDFNARQFEQLRLMAEAIRPDHIILAYMNGTVNAERLRNLKNEVAPFGCEVIIHHVEPPGYYFGRIG